MPRSSLGNARVAQMCNGYFVVSGRSPPVPVHRESWPILESPVPRESTPRQEATLSFRSDFASNEAYLMREIRTQMQLTPPMLPACKALHGDVRIQEVS